MEGLRPEWVRLDGYVCAMVGCDGLWCSGEEGFWRKGSMVGTYNGYYLGLDLGGEDGDGFQKDGEIDLGIAKSAFANNESGGAPLGGMHTAETSTATETVLWARVIVLEVLMMYWVKGERGLRRERLEEREA